MQKLEDFDLVEKAFYLSTDVVDIARSLLGMYLYTSILGAPPCLAKIVETEAYRAPDDKGSHAYQNKKTKRTEVMFRTGGISYIYLCYGIHEMFNVVTGPKDCAHAILIRAVEPVTGIEEIKKRRKKENLSDCCNGPGKLCAALGIDRSFNASTLYDPASNIRIYRKNTPIINDIISSPRVGIAYAGESANLPWRFRIESSPFTSKPDEVNYG